jgi:RNA polymerase sigma-70 factor (ECF subfamily)
VTDADAALAAAMREQWGRLVALLLAQFRRLDLVEDALSDAFEAAARRWPADGVPDNPPAWLLTSARRRIRDRLRAEAMAQRKEPLLLVDTERRQEVQTVRADPGGLVEDERLRLVLMCAHPALGQEAAAALSLRLVVGVETREIARLFLVPEATMAARITRAKKKIVGAGIPFGVPDADALPERLDVVAQVAYLAFTAGYAPGSGPDLLRADVAGEAIRLVRVAREVGDAPVLRALLALTLLQHSRRDARLSDGALVLLPDQDRSRWHAEEIAEAASLLESLDPGECTGLARSYRLQALIAAEHALARSAEETRWDRIAERYAELEELTPSPAIRVARAVAVSEADGPLAGLELLGDDVAALQPGSHRPLAVRAELLARAGDIGAARAAFAEAVAACRNDVERAHLESRLAELDS